MALASTNVAALSFAPGRLGMQPHPLPALGRAATRLHSPAMLLEPGTTSWLADAVLLDQTAQGAQAAAAAAAEEPGLFETCAAARCEPCTVFSSARGAARGATSSASAWHRLARGA